MWYKGVEITKTKSGKYELASPVNGTRRIFKNLELAKTYIENAEAIDSHAMAMNRNKWN